MANNKEDRFGVHRILVIKPKLDVQVYRLQSKADEKISRHENEWLRNVLSRTWERNDF